MKPHNFANEPIVLNYDPGSYTSSLAKISDISLYRENQCLVSLSLQSRDIAHSTSDLQYVKIK